MGELSFILLYIAVLSAIASVGLCANNCSSSTSSCGNATSTISVLCCDNGVLYQVLNATNAAVPAGNISVPSPVNFSNISPMITIAQNETLSLPGSASLPSVNLADGGSISFGAGVAPAQQSLAPMIPTNQSNITIQGNLVMEGQGCVVTMDSNVKVSIMGNAMLCGTLILNVTTPIAVSSNFTIMIATSMSGNFSNFIVNDDSHVNPAPTSSSCPTNTTYTSYYQDNQLVIATQINSCSTQMPEWELLLLAIGIPAFLVALVVILVIVFKVPALRKRVLPYRDRESSLSPSSASSHRSAQIDVNNQGGYVMRQ